VESSLWIIILGAIALLSYIIYKTILIRSEYEERKEITGKRWKLEEMIFFLGDGVVFSYSTCNILLFLDFSPANHYLVQLLMAILLVVFALVMYIIGAIIPENAEELLRKNYPEYELSI
jgi:cytochrome c biogenesis protein CcdA